MPSDRMRRVDEAVRQVLSDAVAHDLQDPRIGFVTMTSVKTSPDLRHARVYVSVLGDEAQRASTLAGLRSAHGALQRQGQCVERQHGHGRDATDHRHGGHRGEGIAPGRYRPCN